ncbi:VIT1/CCC1 transporter family protein [Solicola sp. PLA-1-18]|uniref:VIT1/CCC1 transporter family protein n=1 Tax=Solicola sp. PLA-1-18 TaxID=3380532 RepID=UPI003B79736E
MSSDPSDPLRPVHSETHSHPDVAGGWLRPAVFGAMDGLVSNFALIIGVAGGSSAGDRTPVVLAGLVGLAAGAFSMAAGEYTSVASQSELARAEVDVERREIAQNAPGEEAELAERFVTRGVDPVIAAEVARQIHDDPEIAVRVHAREELGIDTDDLPSPVLAAGSSFLAFAIGALLPLLPFLLGVDALWPSIAVSLLALFACGAVVTRVTARPWWFGGLRQLAIGVAAAGVTYLLGTAFGASGA